MARVALSISEFRQRFPAFSDTTKYSDSFIETMLGIAQLYISPETNCLIAEDIQKQLI